MKTLLFLLLPLYTLAQPPGWTDNDTKSIVLHGDTTFIKNWTRSDSVPILSMAKTIVSIKDSAKYGVTLSTIQTALGFTPSSGGYAINVQALTSSPVDNTTTFFGNLPKALTTTAGQNKIFFRKAGTIKLTEIYCYSGTAGTAESWSIYIRKNNTTDYLIATVSAATNERIFTNTSLSIPIVSGDYIEFKSVQPTWATNPLTSILSGYLIIE